MNPAALLNGKAWAVFCVKASGVVVEFCRYRTETDARGVCDRLRALGCAAEVCDLLQGSSSVREAAS